MSVQLVVDREIREAVLKLIEDARKGQEIVLVSPYNHKLPDLVEALRDAHRRRVKIVRYYREGETDPIDHFRNVASFAVDALHAKIYANEDTVLVTSFDLIWGSWNENREIGLLIQDARLVREIKNYMNTLSRKPTRSRSTVKSPKGKTAIPTADRGMNVRKRSDIPEGARLTRTYYGVLYTCTVQEPGSQPKVWYRGEGGLSLTEAARKVTGQENISGPWFWWYGEIQINKLRYA